MERIDDVIESLEHVEDCAKWVKHAREVLTEVSNTLVTVQLELEDKGAHYIAEVVESVIYKIDEL